MATVVSQGVYSLGDNSLPITIEQKNWVNHITGAFSQIIWEKSWKSLSDIIDALYGELPKINGLSLSKPDDNGNITVNIGDDTRLALALGITNTRANKILLFGRKEWEKSFDASGNKNPNLDLVVAAKAFLSKGSTGFKAGNMYLNQVVDWIQFTWNFAYEQTDETDDKKHVIMPVFAGVTDTSIQIPADKKIQTVSAQEFANMTPEDLTAKAEAYRQYIAKTLAK